MRLTISREKLQEGLAAVTASIPAKTTLPVLANIFSRLLIVGFGYPVLIWI
jgi:DNA polymerase III sliding clamp (beta) subunit (PCNA family)